MSQKQIVCETCKTIPSLFSSFLAKASCCRIYLCKTCKLTHSCAPKPKPNLPENQCDRCQNNETHVVCSACSNSKMCVDCDQDVHHLKKFNFHERRKIQKRGEVPELSLNLVRSETNLRETLPSNIKPKDSKALFKNAMVSIGISQMWEKVENEIEVNFKKIIEELEEKKKEIISKVQRKREKQIEEYHDLVREYDEISSRQMKKSMHIQKIDSLKKKIQNLQMGFVEAHDGTKAQRYQINASQFQSLTALVDKIQVNGLLLKISNRNENTHRSKRSSMAFGSSGVQSPSYLKTPRIMGKDKKLSSSIIEVEVGKPALNEEEIEETPKLPLSYKNKDKLKTKTKKKTAAQDKMSTNKISKAKSSTNIFLTPKVNLKKYFNSSMVSNVN